MTNQPDCPPRASAAGFPEGFFQRGSTGQMFVVKYRQWARVEQENDMTRKTVTVVIPDGYESAQQFVEDCGLEISTPPDHPMDVCYCGDYRRDHKDGNGPCIFSIDSRGDGHHGAGRCDRFIFAYPHPDPDYASSDRPALAPSAGEEKER